MLNNNIFFTAVVLLTMLWRIALQDVHAAIIASIKPLGFIAAAISEGIDETQILLSDQISEHNYSLRPSDIKRLRDAELVIWIGPEMETFMQKSIEKLASSKVVTISTLCGVKALLIRSDDKESSNDLFKDKKTGAWDCCHPDKHYYKHYNMHLWFSPKISWLSAIAIHDSLARLNPNNRIKLDANLKTFKEQLTVTDKQIHSKLLSLKGKKFFVFHDAFVYYEKHYGLTSLGYFTKNPEIPISAQRLHEIKKQLIKKNAACIFIEPKFNTEFIKSAVEKIPVRIGIIDPLGINIQLKKTSYLQFLTQLAEQYANCLQDS